MMSLFSMWNHSEFRELRYPEWSGLELCSSSQLSPSKKKNCLLQSMPASAWRITLAASALTDGGVTDCVELVGFTKPVGEDFVKLLAKGLALLVRRTVGEPQANHLGLTGTDM